MTFRYSWSLFACSCVVRLPPSLQACPRSRMPEGNLKQLDNSRRQIVLKPEQANEN